MVLSLRQEIPRSLRYASTSRRSRHRMGRRIHSPPSSRRRGAMPPSPAGPLPRNRWNSMVSALSSLLWATATLSAPVRPAASRKAL